jgi:aspartate/glutamate racemase
MSHNNKVFAIHTSNVLVNPIKELFNQHLPNTVLNNIIDDSLIQEVIIEGKPTNSVKKRLINYYFIAAEAGADIILNTCSSVGEIAISAQEFINIPIIRIDDSMAEEAVQKASKIGVLATLPSTLKPTCNLIKHKAILQNKNIEIIEGLALGAFQELLAGNTEKHDKLIFDTAANISKSVDLIILAQGSMAKLQSPLASYTGKEVLSSLQSGILKVKKVISEINKKSV